MGLTGEPFVISLEDFQHLKVSLSMIALDSIRRVGNLATDGGINLGTMLSQI